MPKDLYVSTLLDVYGEFLNPKQRRILEYYYNEDLSLAEIAEGEGITRQAVCDTINRTQKKLYSLETKCGYAEKFSKLRSLCENKNNFSKIKEIIENL